MTRGILEQYADKKGWGLRSANILVEGTSDQAYFELASKLVHAKTGKRLIGVDLAVFPPGEGDAGGVPGIQEQFPTARNLSDYDLDRHDRRRFRVVALLDGDKAGKYTAKAIVGAYRSLLMWQDVFLLQRVLPQKTRDPRGLERHVEEHNRQWKGLETEIEDLVDKALFDRFVARYPRYDRIRCNSLAGQYHLQLTGDAKRPFLDFVKQNADLGAISRLVEVIRSMRFYMGLDPDGVETS